MGHPGCEILIADDKETAKTLLTSNALHRSVAGLKKCASEAIAVSQKTRQAFTFWGSFETIDPHDQRNLHKVYIGANLDIQAKLASYKVVVSNDGTPVRMFHFDYEAKTHRKGGERKPSIHLQVGGKPPATILTEFEEAQFNCFFPNVEKVRVFCFPVSLSILLHWLFLEYSPKDKAIQDICDSPGWQGRVKASERSIIKPFIESCTAALIHSNHSKCSLLEHFYQL